jgi:hypothetical protein
MPVRPEDDLLLLRDLATGSFRADAEVTMMSDSAFTSVEQLM